MRYRLFCNLRPPRGAWSNPCGASQQRTHRVAAFLARIEGDTLLRISCGRAGGRVLGMLTPATLIFTSVFLTIHYYGSVPILQLRCVSSTLPPEKPKGLKHPHYDHVFLGKLALYTLRTLQHSRNWELPGSVTVCRGEDLATTAEQRTATGWTADTRNTACMLEAQRQKGLLPLGMTKLSNGRSQHSSYCWARV